MILILFLCAVKRIGVWVFKSRKEKKNRWCCHPPQDIPIKHKRGGFSKGKKAES